MRCVITLLLIAIACVGGFVLAPISGTNRLAAARPKGRALFMVETFATKAEAVEAANAEGAVPEVEPPAEFTQAAADMKAAEKALADKKAAEEADEVKAVQEAEAAAKEAAAAAAAEAERVRAKEAADADREAIKAAAKREFEEELKAATAPRPRVRAGDVLPQISVTSYSKAGKGGRLSTSLLAEAMGGGTSIIVGMPGAFTPTCTDKHLPGLLGAASKFAALNVSKVAVLTTNDGFVNNGWVTAVEACCGNNASGVTMLSDTSGEVVEALGLAGDMGVGLDKRSKRFALVLEGGAIRYVAVDEGLDRLDSTSAAALLRYLDPNAPVESKANPLVLGGLGLVLAAVVATQTGGLPLVSPPPTSPGTEIGGAAVRYNDAGDDDGVPTEVDASVQRAQEVLARKRAERAAREARYAAEDAAREQEAVKEAAAAAKAEAKAEAEAARAAAKQEKEAAKEAKAAAKAAEAKAKADAKEAAKEATQAGGAEGGAATRAASSETGAAKKAAEAEAAAGKKEAKEAAKAEAEAERSAAKAEAKAAREAAAEAKAAAKAEAEAAAAVAKADREMDKAAAAKAKVKATSAKVAEAEAEASQAAAAKKVAEVSAEEAKQEAAAYGGDESVAAAMQMLRDAASAAK